MTHWNTMMIRAVARDIGDGWTKTVIRLDHDDTADAGTSTKYAWGGPGEVEYLMHPSGWQIAPSDTVKRVPLPLIAIDAASHQLDKGRAYVDTEGTLWAYSEARSAWLYLTDDEDGPRFSWDTFLEPPAKYGPFRPVDRVVKELLPPVVPG